jgi:hypothetical protein
VGLDSPAHRSRLGGAASPRPQGCRGHHVPETGRPYPRNSGGDLVSSARSRVEGDKRMERHRAASIRRRCFGRSDRCAQRFLAGDAILLQRFRRSRRSLHREGRRREPAISSEKWGNRLTLRAAQSRNRTAIGAIDLPGPLFFLRTPGFSGPTGVESGLPEVPGAHPCASRATPPGSAGCWRAASELVKKPLSCYIQGGESREATARGRP